MRNEIEKEIAKFLALIIRIFFVYYKVLTAAKKNILGQIFVRAFKKKNSPENIFEYIYQANNIIYQLFHSKSDAARRLGKAGHLAGAFCRARGEQLVHALQRAVRFLA